MAGNVGVKIQGSESHPTQAVAPRENKVQYFLGRQQFEGQGGWLVGVFYFFSVLGNRFCFTLYIKIKQ